MSPQMPDSRPCHPAATSRRPRSARWPAWTACSRPAKRRGPDQPGRAARYRSAARLTCSRLGYPIATWWTSVPAGRHLPHQPGGVVHREPGAARAADEQVAVGQQDALADVAALGIGRAGHRHGGDAGPRQHVITRDRRVDQVQAPALVVLHGQRRDGQVDAVRTPGQMRDRREKAPALDLRRQRQDLLGAGADSPDHQLEVGREVGLVRDAARRQQRLVGERELAAVGADRGQDPGRDRGRAPAAAADRLDLGLAAGPRRRSTRWSRPG